jgi:hypothetical protein
MFKKIVCTALTALLCHATMVSAFAQKLDDAAAIAKVRASIASKGLGDRAKVTLQLKDNREVKGVIASSGANDFTVRDRETGTVHSIPYRDVSSVKGSGMSKGKKIAIFTLIAVGVTGAIVGAKANHFNEFK